MRAATSADIDCLVLIHANGFEAGWDRATLLDFLERDYVTVSGDPINGFAIARIALDEAEIVTLVVDPLVRKRGQGLELLHYLFGALRQEGVSQVFLEVANDNLAALALYQRAGFSQIGLRKAYYARAMGPACDALVMSKQLT